MNETRIRVGITQGDPNGIGWETIIRTFSDPRMTELCTPILFGSEHAAAFYKQRTEECDSFALHVVPSAAGARRGRVNLVETGDFDPQPGVASPAAGRSAVTALRAATAALREGSIDVLVTAPLCKESAYSEDFPFTGHTEFFASELHGQPLMMLCSDSLRIALETIHIPLAEVSGRLTQQGLVSTVRRLRDALRTDFEVVEPRIAVLALNPHAGDGGLLGDEEERILAPAVAEAYGEGILVFGPFAADGFFASAAWRRYDGVVAMYHDQGLAPFKALSPEGVNFTAGLDFIRTSPDHGTAFDIAGRGMADPQSMRAAIYAAIDRHAARHRWKEMSRNPLGHFERDKGRDVSVTDLPAPAEEKEV